MTFEEIRMELRSLQRGLKNPFVLEATLVAIHALELFAVPTTIRWVAPMLRDLAYHADCCDDARYADDLRYLAGMLNRYLHG